MFFSTEVYTGYLTGGDTILLNVVGTFLVGAKARCNKSIYEIS